MVRLRSGMKRKFSCLIWTDEMAIALEFELFTGVWHRRLPDAAIVSLADGSVSIALFHMATSLSQSASPNLLQHVQRTFSRGWSI
jgi:hypothetical protein